uniref:Uncharacterized protein n=1 Tax=Pygocentrus nattereri TaxID=42514 RepID=A0A3B4C6M8_PYGNA
MHAIEMHGVLDVTEDQPNVLGVDGSGEVVVKGLLLLVPPLVPETCHQEVLHVLQVVRVPSELWEVVLDGHRLDLLLQQVCLVEEQDDGDVAEDAVVDYCLEDVERLHQPVGLSVLHQHLNGGDAVETLEPPPPLRPLPPNVHHLEGNILDLKVILVDALGGFAGQQDVLLTGQVVLRRQKQKTLTSSCSAPLRPIPEVECSLHHEKVLQIDKICA